MAKFVDSDALDVVNLSLGLDGTGSAPNTELLDGQLDQVLDVSSLVRRGRTIGSTTGVFRVVLRNVHAGAGTLATGWNPYDSDPVGAIEPWPVPVPKHFDVWVLGASVRFVSGSGTCEASVSMDSVLQAFGIDDSGNAIVQNLAFPIAWWNTLVTTNISFLRCSCDVFRPIRIRVPSLTATIGNGAALVFGTVATALSTWDCQLLVGLFPIGLGQDAFV